MNNHASRLDYLYRQYIQKACTWEELQEFFDYVANPSWQKRLTWLADQHLKELSVPEDLPAIDWEHMYRRIIPQAAHSRAGEVHHKPGGLIRRMLVRNNVAAAILILVSGLAGYYFLVTHKEGKEGSVISNDQYYVQQDDKSAKLVPGNDTVAVRKRAAKIVAKQPVYKNKSTEPVEKVYKPSLPADVMVADFHDKYFHIEIATLWPVCDMAIPGIPRENDQAFMEDTTIPIDKAVIPVHQHLLPDSSIAWANIVSSVRYPAAFTGKDRVVEVAGETYFEVRKSRRLPFKVTIRSAAGRGLVKVLGSHFAVNINAYDDDLIKITLLKGKVKVINNAGSSIVLRPGQQAQVTRSNDIGMVKDVDVDEVVAWKKK